MPGPTTPKRPTPNEGEPPPADDLTPGANMMNLLLGRSLRQGRADLQNTQQQIRAILDAIEAQRNAGEQWAPAVEALLGATLAVLARHEQREAVSETENKLLQVARRFVREQQGERPAHRHTDEIESFRSSVASRLRWVIPRYEEIVSPDPGKTADAIAAVARNLALDCVDAWQKSLPLTRKDLEQKHGNRNLDEADLTSRLLDLLTHTPSKLWDKVADKVVVRFFRSLGLTSKEAHHRLPLRKTPDSAAVAGKRFGIRQVAGKRPEIRKGEAS